MVDKRTSGKIAQLSRLSTAQLQDLWLKLHRKPAPAKLRREFLVPFLAYRIQENAYGGLKPATHAELRSIARSLERDPTSGETLPRRHIKPGTRFLREWRGESHEVFVTDSDYQYCGVGYRSLSEIARKVTGTRWSGPAFFGLRKARSAQGQTDG